MAVKFPRAVRTSTDLGTSEMSRARREATTRHDFGQQVFGWWEVGGALGTAGGLPGLKCVCKRVTRLRVWWGHDVSWVRW